MTRTAAAQSNTPPVAGFGNSLNFDGSNESVDVPYAAALNPDNFTVEGWVNTRQSNNFAAPFSSRDSSVSGEFRGWNVYNTAAGKWEFWQGSTSGWQQFQGPDVQTNAWVHIAFSYDGATSRFYVDGVERATGSIANFVKNPGKPFRIGASDNFIGPNNAAAWFFNGFVDDVRVWNTVRTAQQLADYRFRYIASPSTESGLVAYWAFNQSSGAILPDLTGHSHTGTLQNMEDSDWQASASPPALPTDENQPVTGYLKASDDDGDPLTFLIVSSPTHGTITNLNNGTGSYTYTPTPGFCGTDSFTFKVNDGQADSNTATANITVACLPDDHGDAPASYLDASHTISTSLRLDLTTPDSESSGYDTANADGDNANGTNDEQGVATPLPTLLTLDTAYTLTNIQAINNTGRAATLFGWIDFNRNGAFEPGERASVNVPATAGTQSVSLGWTGLNSLVSGQSYLRLRLSDQSVLTATGASGIGEVEDYPLQIQTPVAITVNTATGAGGTGWVNSSPAGIACPGNCSKPLAPGTIITLTATSKYGSAFGGWAGGCSGTGACVLTLNADTTVTATFGTAFPVGNGKLAFDSNRDGNNEIYVMNPNGSGQTRLTNNPADDHSPAWSPDGSKIVFWRGNDLYVMNADGSGQTRVTTTVFNLGAPRWSPDGGKLVFGAIVSLTTPNLDIYTINLDGTGLTRLTTSSDQDIQPDWSPDGSKIVFTRSNNIYVMNADGTGQTPLFNVLPTQKSGPRWSPDGAQLTFSMSVGRNGWGIYRVNALAPNDLSSMVELTSNSATNTSPGWSPDGRRIVFESNVDGDFEIIHFLAANGDDPVFPTNNSAADRNPDWQPVDGRGTIVIEKRTAPAGGSGFVFTDTIAAPNTFTLNDGQTKSFINVPFGTYTVTEAAVTGTYLSGLRCSDLGSPTPSTWNVATRSAVVKLDAGETVTCTFTNAQNNLIVVEKVTIPAGGTGFNFTSNIPGSPSFSLNDFGQHVAQVTTGTFTITEVNPAPTYDLTGIVCSIVGPGPNDFTSVAGNLSTGSVRVPLTLPGQAAQCSFANTKRGSLTVIKNSVGGDGAFGFTSSIPGTAGFVLTTTSGTVQRSFPNLPAGSYFVTENATAGWVQTGATCSNGNNPASINVGPGENVTCIFTNTRLGSITFVKKTEGGDGTFSYSSPQLGSFRLTTQKKTAQRAFLNLRPGTYSASEAPTKGWDLASATCSDGSNPSGINLAAGENVTCNFTNVQRGSITVVKNSTGGDATFPFASAALGAFSMTTVGGTAQQDFDNLLTGTYDLSESVPAGWAQAGATCSDGSNPASVNVAPGESVTCTFANVKQGSLTVVKQATGSDAAFPFASTALGSFVITTTAGTGQQRFDNINPGVYDLSENLPPGWAQTGATCSDGSTLPLVNVGANEDVTCTFANQQLDTIVIVKLAVGGDDAFAFTSTALGSFVLTTTDGFAAQGFSGLAPGTYSVTEQALAGWTPLDADPECSNGDTASSITLGAGETVVCIFTNLKQDTIVVEKRTVGGDGSFTFDSNLPGAASFVLNTTNGVASQAFDNLPSGTYRIAERLAPGWVQTGASCDNGATPDNISLAPGATVRCIFTDTKLSSITVVKQATGGNGSFAFTGSLGAFNLATAGGTAQRTFANLLPGSYRISETVPAGWRLTRAGCSDGNGPALIPLAAGEDVTCTFANTKSGSLTVVVDATGGSGAFRFDSQALGSFVITTTAGTGQQAFANLAPGSYDLTEQVVPGWNQGLATCSNGSNPAGVTVAAGESVICTFENTNTTSTLFMPIVARQQ